jgi:hypothetical protein
VHNSTDRTPAVPGATELVDTALVARVLLGMAAHFQTTRPADAAAGEDILLCLGVSVYAETGRRIGAGSGVSAAVSDHLPEPVPGCSRREYAVALQEAASAITWSEDVTERAIPTIPAQGPQFAGGGC